MSSSKWKNIALKVVVVMVVKGVEVLTFLVRFRVFPKSPTMFGSFESVIYLA